MFYYCLKPVQVYNILVIPSTARGTNFNWNNIFTIYMTAKLSCNTTDVNLYDAT